MIQLSLRRALSRATAPSWREASISLQQPAVRIQWHRPRFEHHQSYEARVPPSIFQVSFWRSLIPKPFRRAEQQDTSRDPAARKEWNPATFFIFAFLLVGSMSIQMISLNKDFDAFMRRADVRIGKLREVIEKIQRGEKVDVEKALGTGDAEREAEWEEGEYFSLSGGAIEN